MNRFVDDDVWHRLLAAAQTFCAVWSGLSVAEAFGARSTQFVLLYLVLWATTALM